MCLYLDNNITYLAAQMNGPIIANGCYATVYAIRRACRRYVVRTLYLYSEVVTRHISL